MQSFEAIGTQLGMTGEAARLIYNRSLRKMRLHLMGAEELGEYMDSLPREDLVSFVQEALKMGTLVEQGSSAPQYRKHEVTQAFKKVYRKFVVNGEFSNG